jgi:protein-tyrosine-phosphatase
MAQLPGSVLFACTSNAIRSPMAAGLMRHLFGRWVFVDSVGLRRGELDVFAVEAMDEIGIDIANHKAKTFDELEDTSFDVIVTLSPQAQHRAVELTRTNACEVEFWPTLDPSIMEGNRETRLGHYRLVRDGLLARIKQRFGLPRGPSL